MKTMVQRRVSIRTNTNLRNLDTDTASVPVVQPEVVRLNPNQEIIKSLNSKDPKWGKNSVHFSYNDMRYVTVEHDEHFITVLDLEPSVLHEKEKLKNLQDEYYAKKKKFKGNVKKIGDDIKENEKDSYKSIRNHLTFAERESQTINPKIISREVQTVKLQRNNHCGTFHAWDLFDKYMKKYIDDDIQRIREEESKFGGGKASKVKKVEKVEKNVESLAKPSLLKTLKLVERQIMQIINADKYLCYREWHKQDDTPDTSKMLFMLLGFPDKYNVKNRSVTALCWNAEFEDLFAVGYGSYGFPKKKDDKEKTDERGEERSDDMLENGYIYIFSIKNNHYPEIKYVTETGVLSLDFHPKQFSLLVAGMYDGTVAVYDIKQKIKTPIITCDIRTQRHMDPVWQVKWYTAYSEVDEYVFFSISSDGRVVKWSFFRNKTQLESEEIIALKYSDTLQSSHEGGSTGGMSNSTGMSINNSTIIAESENKEKADDTIVFGNAGGMCFDFNPHKGFDHLFVLGTEEGHIHLCSVKHRGHYMQTYEGHSMGVYTVAWNPFHEKLFASCSSDWHIKIWHYKIFAPLVVYDMQTAIGDVAWSPSCSTIFAAVTVTGDIKFFDLNRARKNMGEGKKYQDIPINHIAFNKKEFVFLTGNDRGKVRLWKMAEPLRTTVRPEEEEQEKEKKAGNDKKTNFPETKIVIPKNMQNTSAKTKKHIEIKKDNKMAAITSPEYIAAEKERIYQFLSLLDVKDI
jgi:dynein intermediate chain 1